MGNQEHEGFNALSSRHVCAYCSSDPLVLTPLPSGQNHGKLDTTPRQGLPVRWVPRAPRRPRGEGGIRQFCTCIRVFLISICSDSERQLPFGRSLFHLFAAIAPVQLWSLG